MYTCWYAAHYEEWDCLQYAVDNKCPEWEKYAERTTRSTSDEYKLHSRFKQAPLGDEMARNENVILRREEAREFKAS